MRGEQLAEEWVKLSREVVTGMAEWRMAHPQATLCEIEGAIDERLGWMRAQMVQEAALVSAARGWAEASAEEQARCPACGGMLQERGEKKRHLQTHGGQEIVLTRTYGECPDCGAGLFPPG